MSFLFILGLLTVGQAHASPLYETGEEVEVCKKPDQIVHLQHFSGAPYFLNYGNRWPENYLTIVIWERDISDLEINPYRYFQGEKFCMKGKITKYNGNPQLVIRDISQLVINRDTP